ncbi:MAG: hypothetical protein ABFD96_14615 [Armatimonadia bacterium]
MTPDIRDKAEDMVRGFLLFNKQDYLLGTDWHRDLAENISQALLEAHKAGREEMREEAAKVAKAFEDELLNMAEDDRFSRPATAKPSQDELRLAYRSATANDIATAIRSIK